MSMNDIKNNNLPEDEINFKALLKNPARLYGWFFILFFLVLLGIGIYYVKNLDMIYFNSVPEVILDSTAVKREIQQKKGGLVPAVNLEVISKPSDDLISKGKELFDANCKSCHGEQGMGDGPAGASLNPLPRNFHQKEGWVNGRNFDEMYKTLQEGIPNSGMTAYEYLSPADRFALIHYIRSLTNDYPEITDTQLSDLDLTYDLQKPTLTPNQIPVEKAIAIISEENSYKTAEVMNWITKIKNDPSTGAVLFRSYISDYEKTLTALLVNGGTNTFPEFVNLISAQSVDIGINPQINNLPDRDLKLIFDFLINLKS